MPYQLTYNKALHDQLYKLVKGGFEWPKKDDIFLEDKIYFKGWFYSANLDVKVLVSSDGVLVSSVAPSLSRADVSAAINIVSSENLGFEFCVHLDGVSKIEVSVAVGDECYKLWDLSPLQRTVLNKEDINFCFLQELHKNHFDFNAFLDSFSVDVKSFWENFWKIKAAFLVLNEEECRKYFLNELHDDCSKIIADFARDDWAVEALAKSCESSNLKFRDVFTGNLFHPTQSFVVDDKNFIALTDGYDIFYVVQHSCNICLIYPKRMLVIRIGIVDPWVDEVVKAIPRFIKVVTEYRRDEFLRGDSKLLGLNVSHSRPYHYFYDYMFGLYKLNQLSEVKFKAFSLKGFDFLDLTPLPNISDFSSVSEEALNSYARDRGGYLFMPCFQFLFDNAQEDIAHLSNFLFSNSINNIAEQTCNFLDNYRFVFWVGISTEKRSWLEQIDGIIKISLLLKKKYGRILVLVDGRTFPLSPCDNDFRVRARDEHVLKSLVEQCKDIEFHSLIGLTPLEKMSFARKIDFFLSSFATDSMYPSAFSAKPGVVYVAPSIGNQRYLHVHHKTISVPSEKITEINKEYKSWHETNVSMNWKDVNSCIEQLLGEAYGMHILDCTLRDGGYYNGWNFPLDVTNKYLEAMHAAGVDIVELGLRSLINNGFKGASAYTTDSYLRTLTIPAGLKVAVMINATELVGELPLETALETLFPVMAENTPVDVVRIACHVHEFVKALPACHWLKARGYTVGFNLMQVADRSQAEIEALSLEASKFPIDALYFADSMGSMDPKQTSQIIGWLRKHWQGAMGIHTHDNMGLALANTLQALTDGVTWLDATVTGMGRGPGNARTEELVIEVADRRKQRINMVPLMSIIKNYFQPLKNKCGWGSNPYYYLSGKYGIHPTYIQEMLGDSRYSEEDILAAINHLKAEGGKKFSFNALDATRHFYQGNPRGSWSPKSLLSGRDVLILGAGPGVAEHKIAIESFITAKNPIVIALNTQSSVAQHLIDVRVACHPVRLLADCEAHTGLPQPLITPASMLPADVTKSLAGKTLYDFGLAVHPDTFSFADTHAILPSSLVISYALAVASSGQADQILLAGFDGYGADDPRTSEMQHIFASYQAAESAIPLISITPTTYNIPTLSVYAL